MVHVMPYSDAFLLFVGYGLRLFKQCSIQG